MTEREWRGESYTEVKGTLEEDTIRIEILNQEVEWLKQQNKEVWGVLETLVKALDILGKEVYE